MDKEAFAGLGQGYRQTLTCTGAGANGDHCCYIAGKVCEFLVIDTDKAPRCSIFDTHPTPEWEAAIVGRWFAENYPGRNCRDWPQNIPEVMAKAEITGPFGLCCWGRGNA